MGDFRVVPEIPEGADPNRYKRAYSIQDGDVLSYFDIVLQFDKENRIFNEVVESIEYEYWDGIRVAVSTHTKTGKTFTVDDLNKIARKHNEEMDKK